MSCAGPGKTPTAAPPSCRECGGTGWKRDPEGAYLRCRCAVEADARRSVPPLYRGALLADFSAGTAGCVSAWIAAPTAGLFVCGPTGVGKTRLACAAAIELNLNRGRPGRAVFRPAAALYRAIRAAFADNTDALVVEEHIEAEVLMIDDLASGGLSDFERRIMLEILEARLQSVRPTVVTSNWDLEQIAERMDDRIASRLAGYTQVAMAGGDRRLGMRPPD